MEEKEGVPQFYSLQIAAKKLQLSRPTLYKRAKEGKLRITYDNGGRPIIFKDELIKYLNGGGDYEQQKH